MKNPEPVENSKYNAPPEAQGDTNATNQPHYDDSTEESPKSYSHDDAKICFPADVDHPKDYAANSSPPTYMHAPPPPPYQAQMMPPPPPFLPPMMMQLPHPHLQFPPYLNHQLLFPPYVYPMIFPSAPPPNMLVEKRNWTTGLFDCFSDLKNCFITTFCPCLTFGQVFEILNEGQTPWWEGAIAYIVVEIATMSMGTFLCALTYRAKMRRRHFLRGSLLRDLIVSFFFTRFALCQLYRQLDQLGYNVPLGWIANKDKQGLGAVQNKFQVIPPAVESGMFRH